MERFNLINNEIKKAIEDPKEKKSVLSGFSGEKLLTVLQNLSKKTLNDDECYLEVGVYQGLSLLSVANEIGSKTAYGVDNFAFFDSEGNNLNIINERIAKLNLKNVKLLNSDYEDAMENLASHIGEKKVGVYFIDGPHDYRSQLMCLMLIKPFLSKNAIIIIDDSNYRHVRLANSDFLQTHPEFKLFFEAYTPSHPHNMTEENEALARKGWWNGVNIIVKDENNFLPNSLPLTLRSRDLFENEHALHSIKYPLVLMKLLRISNIIGSMFNKKLKKKKAWYEGKYNYMNTYSESLPTSRFNYKKSNK
jgi:predicted O-methyltransferase YrrM